MTQNSYAPPAARVDEPAARPPRQFSWRVAMLFALRFSGAAAASLSVMLFMMATVRTHRPLSLEPALEKDVGYSLIAGSIAMLWIWLVAVLTAFFARTSIAGRGWWSLGAGILCALLTHAIVKGLVRIDLNSQMALAVLAAWALVFPIVATLILMRPKSA